MPIAVKTALAAQLKATRRGWNEDSVILYHLCIGAGLENPTDPSELQYGYEQHLKVLPTFAVIPVAEALDCLRTVPGVELNFDMVLHGEQEIEILRPIPVTATEAVHEPRIAGIYDKGKAALIVLEALTKVNNEPLFVNRCSVFARGEGGFGGDSGPKVSHEPPSRAPDAVVESRTLPNQALLYRLLGDKNPLHADPVVAKRGGFERPLLHGLCSYGVVCKAAVDAMLGGDVTRVARYHARFTGVVFPGATIATSLWKEGKTLVISAKDRDRSTPVVSGVITMR